MNRMYLWDGRNEGFRKNGPDVIDAGGYEKYRFWFVNKYMVREQKIIRIYENGFITWSTSNEDGEIETHEKELK